MSAHLLITHSDVSFAGMVAMDLLVYPKHLIYIHVLYLNTIHEKIHTWGAPECIGNSWLWLVKVL